MSHSHTKFGWILSSGLGGDSITNRRRLQYPLRFFKKSVGIFMFSLWWGGVIFSIFTIEDNSGFTRAMINLFMSSIQGVGSTVFIPSIPKIGH